MPITKGKKRGGKQRGGRRDDSSSSRKPADICKDKSDPFQVYGQVIAAVGNKRFSVRCQKYENPSEYCDLNCNMKGSLRKNIAALDYVLVQRWDFEPSKGTIIDKYNALEKGRLENKGFWDYVDDPNMGKAENSVVPAGYDLMKFAVEETETTKQPEKVTTAYDALTAAGLEGGGDDIDIDVL